MDLISKAVDGVNSIDNQMRILRRWGHLGESSFSRIYSIFTDPKYVVGMISAYTLPKEFKEGKQVTKSQAEKFADENVAYTIKMGKEFKSEGFGYKFVDGHWVYSSGDIKFNVPEDTLLVIAPAEKEKELFKSLVQKQIEYEQETFIFKNSKGDIKMYNARNSAIEPVMTFNKLHFDSLNTDFFTKLKTGNHAGRKFVFESCNRSDGFSSSYLEYLLLKQLNIDSTDITF